MRMCTLFMMTPLIVFMSCRKVTTETTYKAIPMPRYYTEAMMASMENLNDYGRHRREIGVLVHHPFDKGVSQYLVVRVRSLVEICHGSRRSFAIAAVSSSTATGAPSAWRVPRLWRCVAPPLRLVATSPPLAAGLPHTSPPITFDGPILARVLRVALLS